ncbi:hypothetical protein [Microbacterium sp. SS28]|uniref:hypothetical protein n=1 Tax=Microbacterium sp. SS28 TaxID=2919948 RepID=UPI001FAAA6E5|nr:hypothetical protein [Microbacterium sp. SS28]
MLRRRAVSILLAASAILALGLSSAAPAVAADAAAPDAAATGTPQWETIGRATVSGTPSGGSTMTADPGTWVPTPDSFDYQWQAGGAPLSGATGQTFTLPEGPSDATYRVAVTAHKAGYPQQTAYSAPFEIISFDGFLDALDADPGTTISGRFASSGATIGSAAIDGFPAAGADYLVLSTGNAREALRTFPPGTQVVISTGLETAPAGVGGWDMSTITITVDPPDAASRLALDYAFATEESPGTRTKDVLTIESPTSQLSIADDHERVIAPNNLAFDSAGRQLNADSEDLSPIAGNGINRWSPRLTALIPLRSGATDVIVSIQDIGDESADSVVLLDNLRTVVDPVCASGAVWEAPSITGTPAVDAVLTGDPGRFPPSGRLNYRWLRDGQPIAGAVDTTYRVGVADLGARLSFRVTTVDTTPIEKRTSAPTARVGLAAFTVVPVPTVTGSRTVGRVLTAQVGEWSPEPQTVAFQWRRDGAAIPGARSVRYTLTAADEGARVDVKIVGLRLGYRPGAADSADGPRIAPKP